VRRYRLNALVSEVRALLSSVTADTASLTRSTWGSSSTLGKEPNLQGCGMWRMQQGQILCSGEAGS
jgi:hypothetical protein